MIESKCEAGEAGSYRIEPKERWLARASAVKPRPVIPALRMRVRNGSVRLMIPGKGIAELAGEPEVRLGAGGCMAVTVTGADISSVRIPTTARVAIADGVELLDENHGKRLVDAFGAPGSPATPLPDGLQGAPGSPTTPPPPLAGKGIAQNVPGSPATPHLFTPAAGERCIKVSCEGGYVNVCFKFGRRLLSSRERRLIGRTPLDEALGLFISKGFRAQAIRDPEIISVSGRTKKLKLDGPCTGEWDKVLLHVERRINANSFSTWFRPTRELGTREGNIIVVVPTAIFRKKLSVTYGEIVDAARAETGRVGTIEYVCAEDTDVEEFPATALAGKQHNQSQRRIA